MRSTITTTAIPASIQPFIWFKNEKALNTFVFTSFANAINDAVTGRNTNTTGIWEAMSPNLSIVIFPSLYYNFY